MTKKQKLKILWELFFVAEGLSYMTQKRICYYNVSVRDINRDLPYGICYALILLNYVSVNCEDIGIINPGKSDNYWFPEYWWPAGDWRIRKKVILNAIKEIA